MLGSATLLELRDQVYLQSPMGKNNVSMKLFLVKTLAMAQLEKGNEHCDNGNEHCDLRPTEIQ